MKPRMQFCTATAFVVITIAVVSSDVCSLLFLVRRANPKANRLFGLVVKASASRAEDPGFESHLQRDFSLVESYQ